MNFIVVIPARFASTRFPGKLLADVCGKPMIVRVIQHALQSGAQQVILATDSIKIIHVVESEKLPVEICLTKSDHNSGIERIEEVAVRYKFLDHQIIVHLQGDEPLITSNIIYQMAQILNVVAASVATLAVPISSILEAKNDNVVKVIVDINNYALYFSRSMIPWFNYRLLKNNQFNISNIFLRHIGIYSYRVCLLHRYVKWCNSVLEDSEVLEQLRVLWNGEKVYVSLIKDAINIISVDTPETLCAVNKFCRDNKFFDI